MSRVEGRRGGLGHVASLRFLSPLIKPDVRISRIRLSDWLHPEAHAIARFLSKDFSFVSHFVPCDSTFM
jgi:hypothetical protein